VERHGFRQTQTAISAFWLSRGSPLLAYETPVLGPPWAIPFEFPFYQWTVSLLSSSTHMPIDQSGRAIGLLFFYGGLVPVAWLVRRLLLPPSVLVTFALLYLASPLYLFWSRTVLVETTAMTLSLAYLCSAVVSIYRPFRWRRCASASAFGLLAASVKITTFAGGLLGASLFCLFLWIRRRPGIKFIVYSLVPLLSPVAAGLAWTWFADGFKMRNPLQFLGSDELAHWNLGVLSLRMSRAFWVVMGHRMLGDLLGRAWPIILVASVVVAIVHYKGRRIGIGTVSVLAFCVGPLVFANLYYVHDYYPCGGAAYLYLALAVLWGSVWHAKRLDPRITYALLLIFLVGSAYTYHRNYYPDLRSTKSPFVDTAMFLKSVLSRNEIVIIYGTDWDSTIAYYSEHRAIMDRLYRSIHSAQLVDSLGNLRPGQRVGAVVGCAEARDGWYRSRVLNTAMAFGLSSQPAFQNSDCSVYLAASRRQESPNTPSSSLVESPDDTWWVMPAFGASPQLPTLVNPSLEGLGLAPLMHDPSRTAPIEGPAGVVAILANPGTQLVVTVPAQSARVIVRYGVKAYAWRVHELPPVTFEMIAVHEEQHTTIWRRSLDPARQTGDRGIQESVVPMPPGSRQMILGTMATKNSISHRAYWSGIEFR
jgi:hypothetical protein